MLGLDNNLTRNLSTRDPLLLVFVKGCGAGGFSLLLARFFNLSFPSFQMILIAMAIGVVSYGLSIVFFILSLRSLGSSRTTALYSIAPCRFIAFFSHIGRAASAGILPFFSAHSGSHLNSPH